MFNRFKQWWNRVVNPKPAPLPSTLPSPPTPTPTPVPTPTSKTLLFRDDFLDLRNWKLYDSPGHDGKGLRKPDTIAVANSILSIHGDSAGRTGGMSLVGHDIRYGTVSVRLRTPVGAGKYHPVALLWGLGSGSAVDAVTGEIDFIEFWNRPNRDISTFTLHYGDGTQMVGIDGKPMDGTQWHTYTVEWRQDFIAASVDGIEYYRTTDKSKFPKNAMELCLQLDWFPNENTSSGTGLMEVDWVEIYA